MTTRRAYDEVSADEAQALLEHGAVLVDVRTRWEWDTGHVPGAVHVPLERVRRSHAIPRDAQVVTICRSGHRSALAARWLARRGARVVSVRGGLPAWVAAGHEVTAPRVRSAASSDGGPPAFIAPPRPIPIAFRLPLRIVRRQTGMDVLPARLLTWYPRAAVGAAALESTAARPVGRVDARMLKLVRMTVSFTASCPFCIGLNGEGWEALISEEELAAVQGLLDLAQVSSLDDRERLAIRYARAISATPIEVDTALGTAVAAAFTEREAVALAATAAQVNYWARLIQGLGAPAPG
ncbi:rhodanese-like domain-containing protein [Amnibacterium sp.]|uniref:rhodanese-like domain-containing protein n=1 Tax=Amnibacterium sp. TaxID=1872496 RepID=UPI003F7C1223